MKLSAPELNDPVTGQSFDPQKITGTAIESEPGVFKKRGLDVVARNTPEDPSYIQIAPLTNGQTSQVTGIDSTSWTLITRSLASSIQLNIQNNTGRELKLRFDNSGGYVGITLKPSGERQYTITDGAALYVRAKSGSGLVLDIEELAP